MDKASEYWNRVLPLGGNPGTVQKGTLGHSTAGTSIDIRTIFGNVGLGDFLTAKAEGPAPGNVATGLSWTAYLSMSPRAGTLSTSVTAAGSGLQAWPLGHLQEISGKFLSGKAETFATSPSLAGFATMVSHNVLNISCNTGSGLLHLARSTLPPIMDAGQFRPPVGSAMFPPGPSGWVGPYA